MTVSSPTAKRVDEPLGSAFNMKFEATYLASKSRPTSFGSTCTIYRPCPARGLTWEVGMLPSRLDLRCSIAEMPPPSVKTRPLG